MYVYIRMNVYMYTYVYTCRCVDLASHTPARPPARSICWGNAFLWYAIFVFLPVCFVCAESAWKSACAHAPCRVSLNRYK